MLNTTHISIPIHLHSSISIPIHLRLSPAIFAHLNASPVVYIHSRPSLTIAFYVHISLSTLCSRPTISHMACGSMIFQLLLATSRPRSDPSPCSPTHPLLNTSVDLSILLLFGVGNMTCGSMVFLSLHPTPRGIPPCSSNNHLVPASSLGFVS